MTSVGGPSEHPVDILIRELVRSGRAATLEEVAQIIERMANAPFSTRMRTVPMNERGAAYLGITLTDRVASFDYHLVKRVVLEEQWAYGTTADQYLDDLRQAIQHPEAHLAVYGRRDGPDRGRKLPDRFCCATGATGIRHPTITPRDLLRELGYDIDKVPDSLSRRRSDSGDSAMADMTKATPKERIDRHLSYEFHEWENIPWLESEWNSWHPETQLTFMFDWDVVTSRLRELRRWAEEGLMTAEQQERFAELERLVAQHEPTLKRLFDE